MPLQILSWFNSHLINTLCMANSLWPNNSVKLRNIAICCPRNPDAWKFPVTSPSNNVSEEYLMRYRYSANCLRKLHVCKKTLNQLVYYPYFYIRKGKKSIHHLGQRDNTRVKAFALHATNPTWNPWHCQDLSFNIEPGVSTEPGVTHWKALISLLKLQIT